MLKVFIRYSDLLGLFDRFKADEDFRFKVYGDLLRSKHINLVVYCQPGENIDDSNAFILFMRRACRLILKEYQDDFDDLNMYNDGRGVVFDHRAGDSAIQCIRRTALIYMDANSNADILNKLAPLFGEYAIRTGENECIGKLNGLPVSTIVYQDNYILKLSSDIERAKIELYKKIKKVFFKFITDNVDFFYEKTLYLDFIYGQTNDRSTHEDLNKITTDVSLKIKQQFLNSGVDVVCRFRQGAQNPHDRYMVSDYFAAFGGNGFYESTLVSTSGILRMPDTYKMIYNKVLTEFSDANRMNILKPD